MVIADELARAQWGIRLWSLKCTYWEPNYGGLWEDNHNAFILQSASRLTAPIHRINAEIIVESAVL